MQITNKITAFILLMALLPACQQKVQQAAGDGHPHEEAAAEEEMEEASLTTVQMEKIGLKTSPVEKKNLTATLKVNGQLELPPQNKADVSPVTGGIIKQIHIRPGQYVKKGAVLATLQNPDFIQMQEDYLVYKARLTFLDKEYRRQQELLKEDIGARKEFERVTSEREEARARLHGLEAKLKMLDIPLPEEGQALTGSLPLRAPINGYVRNIMANTGQYAGPQDQVFEIVDNHHIHIDLMVFEKDIKHLYEGQHIKFILQSNPQEMMEARIFAIGKALETEERAVRVHAEIDNARGNLLPGMYVEARIVLEDALVDCLPEEAITTDKGLYYIFVVHEKHEDEVHFRKVQVLTGASDVGYVEVTPLDGLPPNAQIATEGAFYLMAQTKKGEEGGGHHH